MGAGHEIDPQPRPLRRRPRATTGVPSNSGQRSPNMVKGMMAVFRSGLVRKWRQMGEASASLASGRTVAYWWGIREGRVTKARDVEDRPGVVGSALSPLTSEGPP